MPYSLAVKNKTKWFVDTYGAGIAKAIKGTGLFFPAVVAQKALESGWGESDLTKLYHNWGGIKCNTNLPGAVGCIKYPTTESKNGKLYKTTGTFTRFKDTEAGIKAVSTVLMKDRYTNARNNATSAKEQVKMIVKAGYSTMTPEAYLAQLSGIIEAVQDYKGLGRIA